MTKYSISLLLAAAMLNLAGCGSSGNSATTTTTTTIVPTVQTITGIVATGAPVSGASVTVKDNAGKTVVTTSATDGSYSAVVTGLTPPFMLVATKPGKQNLYSALAAMDMASTNTQNVNITTITTLVIYELNGGTDPASMYSGTPFSSNINASNISAKEQIVRGKAPVSTVSAANMVNPIFKMMYDKFTATGTQDSTGYDSAMDALGNITAMTSSSVTFSVANAYTPASSGSGTGGTTTTATPSISLILSSNSISTSSTALVTATVTDANGAAVAGAIVTFTTSDPVRDTFSGGANTALTNSIGVASVTLTTSNTSGGASTVTASSTINGTSVNKSLNYAIGSSSISLSTLSLPASTLSAYGTASISVTVQNSTNNVVSTYTTPMSVSFSSACAAAGKATLTQSVTTINGVATASYLDNGCNNASPGDTITATLMNGVTATGNLPVNSPSVGSIKFVSVTPTTISLKGTGGLGLSESSRVVFSVVDSANHPLGNALVDFSLNTAVGGLALSSSSATSDPVTGYVVTNVLSGTFSTAVRVTATVRGTTPTLSSQSDQLLVTTGLPSQDSFSLSASTHNIEGWAYDGMTTTLTARLADHFHNPVPDGTAVYYTSEGGSINPSCTTVGGVCSVVLTSQELRPHSTNNGYGRVTVLARATGEESFTDTNANGLADPGEMLDANGLSTDMGEAYVDFNENGIHDANEPFVDFNIDGVYTGTTLKGTSIFESNGNYHSPVGASTSGDVKYNGILCNPGAGNNFCSPQKSIDVRGSQVIIFSDSWAASSSQLASITPASVPITAPAVPAVTLTGIPSTGIVLDSCTTTGAKQNTPSTVIVTVVDSNGNAMPAGTTVAFSTSNGSIPTPATWTVPDTIGCRTGFAGCPASAASSIFGDINVSLVSDAAYDSIALTCTNKQSGGTFTVTVTTPKGNISSYSMGITD
jgi:hypothetical protein